MSRSPLLAIGNRPKARIERGEKPGIERREKTGIERSVSKSGIERVRRGGLWMLITPASARFRTTVGLPGWSRLDTLLPRYCSSARRRSGAVALLRHRVRRHCHQQQDAENETAH